MLDAVKIGKTDAVSLANFILVRYGPMSHLKLQKLLYYCQSYHLAYFEEALFEEDFRAWVHGPVCQEVYHQLKGAGFMYSDIKYTGDTQEAEMKILKTLSSDQCQIIYDVLGDLSTWSGLELETSTHREAPWIDARSGYGAGDVCNAIIPKNHIKDYYKKEINDRKQDS